MEDINHAYTYSREKHEMDSSFRAFDGPHWYCDPADRLLEWLGSVDLAALFFMAGMDLELRKIKRRPLSLAVRGWTVSLVLGFIAAAVLHVLPFVGILLARFGIYSLKLSQASGGWTECFSAT
jgi:hypothetical protein